jgi:hypothetical protein
LEGDERTLLEVLFEQLAGAFVELRLRARSLLGSERPSSASLA